MSLISYSTSMTLFAKALLNLRAASMISSFGIFGRTLILCETKRTDLTIHSALVLGA